MEVGDLWKDPVGGAFCAEWKIAKDFDSTVQLLRGLLIEAGLNTEPCRARRGDIR